MKNLSRRHLLALMSASPFIPRAQAADLSGETLRIASFRGFDSYLLPETGLANFPYKVVFSEFNSGAIVTQALNADALDLGGMSEIPTIFAANSHARIAIVATLEGPTTNQAVLTAKNAPYRSVADLRGKRVGYIRGTTAHYFLIRMLQHHGLSFADIDAVPLGMSEGLTAMKAGSLDAWATYGYAIEILQADGTARILEDASEILSGHYFIAANPERLSDPLFADAAADYIRRLGRAYATLSDDKPRWARTMAPVIHVPEHFVLDYLNGQNRRYVARAWQDSDIASAQSVADTFIASGVLPAGLQVKPLFSDALSSHLRG